MTIHVTPYVFTALEILTAAKLNAIQGNIKASWPITAAKQLAYSVASNELAVMTWGSAGQSIVVDATGNALESRKPRGVWDDWGNAERSSGAALVSTAWADIPDLSVTLTLTRACTIYGLMTLYLGASGAGSYVHRLRLSINGVVQTNVGTWSNATGSDPAAVSWFKASVAAGSRIVKGQYKIDAGGDFFATGFLHAWAVVE